MNKKQKIKTEYLVRARCIDFTPSRYHTYKYGKKKKHIFDTEIKEGVYSRLTGYQGKEIPPNHILHEGVIFEKPKVILYFKNGNFNQIFFDTYEEAEHVFSQTPDGKNWLTIKNK